MSKIKVSVLCTAYNHAKYIKDALDGFLMQKTNFDFEVLIHDDASTDGTAEIIKEYAEKYPDIIKPVFQTENKMSKGVDVYLNYLYPLVQGEYVAICDGDDFWIDDKKLQKQVDFLDSHPDYYICFHPMKQVFEDGSGREKVIPVQKNISLDDLLKANFIPSCSAVYRWVVKGDNFKDMFPTSIYPGDWWLNLLHAKHGKIGFLPDPMCCYRRHPSSVSFVATKSEDLLHLKYGVYELRFFIFAEKRIAPNPKAYHNHVCNMATEFFRIYMQNGKLERAKQVFELCPDFLTYRNQDFYLKYKKYKKLFNISLIILFVLIILITLVLL